MAKGWYIIKGVQDGDRTVEEQLTGLGTICANAAGKTVLDLGCAEGLIGLHLVKQCGAYAVDGVTLVPAEIDVGRQVCGHAVRFFQCDLNDFDQLLAKSRDDHHGLAPQYERVLLLSVLHKVRQPEKLLRLALDMVSAGGMVAVRLPAPIINDARSNWKPFDVRPVLQEQFELVETPKGPRNEWQTLWRRRS